VTPTDRLLSSGTRSCDLVPAPSRVSLGAAVKVKDWVSGGATPNFRSPPGFTKWVTARRRIPTRRPTRASIGNWDARLPAV